MFLFLIGMPGSGKTHWLNTFAEALELPPIDMDAFLTEEHRQSIPEMIAKGIDDFRQKEATALRNILSQYTQAVVATGGGTPCYKNNLSEMKSAGIVLYLQCPIALLQSRLSASTVKRPLLKTTSRQTLYEVLEATFRQRKPFYEQADLIFDPQKDRFTELLQKIRLFNLQNGIRNV